MPLETNFNTAPYFDDYDEDKKYYRILFKPATAVQARELTQLQTILQNQIERFADSIYQPGTIIKGCPVNYVPNLDFVRVKDAYTNTNIIDDMTAFTNAVVISNTSGLTAQIITVASGSEVNYPATNRLYIRYMNSGSGGEKTFSNNEVLLIKTKPISANSFINPSNTANVTTGGVSVTTFANTTANTFTVGTAYGITVGEGIIYQKGFFVKVDDSISIVSDTRSIDAIGNTVVGFKTTETIYTSDQDSTLNDNALGYTNENAHGADRVRLTATLEAVDPTTLTDATNFTPIVQFNMGVPVTKNEDPQYSRLGDEFARRQSETNGNYVIKPFTVDTAPHPNTAITDKFRAKVSAGTGYALGHRIELLKTAQVDVRKGTDVAIADAQLATLSYGNYILVKEMAGPFAFTALSDIKLYNTAQQAISNSTFGFTAPTGSQIGSATVRSIVYDSGTPGTPTAQYKVHLFNVRMSANTFADVKAISYVGATANGYADIVQDGGISKIYDSDSKAMIWNFGKKAIQKLAKNSDPSNAQYVFRQQTECTLAVDGTFTLTLPSVHAGGTNKLNYSAGLIGDTNETDFIVTLLANAQSNATVASANVTVTSGSNVVTGFGTSFNTLWNVGDYILIRDSAEVRRVTAVTNATSMTVANNFSTSKAANAYAKFFPAGHVFPLNSTGVNGTRTINVNTSLTSAIVTTGANLVANLTATANVLVSYDTFRYNITAPSGKTIHKTSYVKINTNTHSAGVNGPWSLGLADISKLRNVYVQADTFSNTATDLIDYFYFDSGQRDTHYDMGKLYLKPGKSLVSNAMIFVGLDHFTPDYTYGSGFFSVSSYSVDDANTSNATAITTADIPVYVSEAGATLPLRDCIDFRPYLTNIANTIANGNPSNTQITINPAAAVNAFTVPSEGTYVPSPYNNFESTISYYLPRQDILYFTTGGTLKVKEGISADYATAPEYPLDGMPVATVSIQPYPSLSAQEQSAITTINRQSKDIVRATDYMTQINIVTNRRYTMRDIGVLEDRISNLEYYMSLSLLEKAATDLQIPDTNGLNRFKNGIFAEPFTSHIFGEVSNPEYKIAIDTAAGIARPYFNTESVDLQVKTLTSAQQTGRLVSLPYNSIAFITQNKASKYRSAAPVAWNWAGQARLYPNYDNNIDKTADPSIQVTLDLAQPWQDFANSPFGAQWGSWRTSTSTSSSATSSSVANSGGVLNTTAITTTTSTTSSRAGQKINIDVNNTSYNLGTYIEDIAIQPYMRSREIAFYASQLRPGTQVWPFFDDEPVASYCAPGAVNNSITDTLNSDIVTRTGAWGANLVSSNTGEVWGKFLIPANTFRVGDRTFKLCDVQDLTTGIDATTTSASTKYLASNFSVKTQSLTLTTINPEVSVSSVLDSTSAITTRTTASQTFVPSGNTPVAAYSAGWEPEQGWGAQAGEPIAQAFRVNAPLSVSGVYLTSMDLYFQKKSSDSKHGINVYICEVLNGYPNTSRILPYSRVRKAPAAVNISNTAATATTFTFDGPVYLTNGLEYAFVVKPDGNDPDYLLWCAELGGVDITTNAQIFSMPYTSTMFISASETAWTALQTEYIKFTLNRAQFTAASGTADLKNAPEEFITIANTTYANTSNKYKVGDRLYKQYGTASGNVNTSVYATIGTVDLVNNKLVLTGSTGNFTAADVLQVHRLGVDPVTGPIHANVAAAATTYIGNSTLSVLNVVNTNAVVPRFAALSPPGTAIGYKYKGTSNTLVKDTSYVNVTAETETELFDYPRVVASRSTEVTSMSSNNSLDVQVSLLADNDYLSPIIDLTRANVLCIENLIDTLSANTTNEYYNYGNVQTKYVSKPVTLDAGQDAEDLKVYLTAYRPPSSDILVYAKLISSDDPGSMTDKSWTLLTCDNSEVYSNYRDTSDYIEYTYSIPSTVPDGSTVLDARGFVTPNTCAYLGATTVTYKDAAGISYSRFKTFKIKVVLLSDSTSRVPKLNDARAIALQF